MAFQATHSDSLTKHRRIFSIFGWLMLFYALVSHISAFAQSDGLSSQIVSDETLSEALSETDATSEQAFDIELELSTCADLDGSALRETILAELQESLSHEILQSLSNSQLLVHPIACQGGRTHSMRLRFIHDGYASKPHTFELVDIEQSDRLQTLAILSVDYVRAQHASNSNLSLLDLVTTTGEASTASTTTPQSGSQQASANVLSDAPQAQRDSTHTQSQPDGTDTRKKPSRFTADMYAGLETYLRVPTSLYTLGLHVRYRLSSDAPYHVHISSQFATRDISTSFGAVSMSIVGAMFDLRYHYERKPFVLGVGPGLYAAALYSSGESNTPSILQSQSSLHLAPYVVAQFDWLIRPYFHAGVHSRLGYSIYANDIVSSGVRLASTKGMYLSLNIHIGTYF